MSVKGKCKVLECNSDIYSLGFCRKHYERYRKYGDPNICFKPLQKIHSEKCTYSGCEKKYYAKGFCKKHYERLNKYGDPSYTQYGRDLEKHGLSHTSEYQIWSNMIRRCKDPTNNSYSRYGGRGITVCDRWKYSFKAFYEDMGPRPFLNAQIDRIYNDGNYEPCNCRWVTPTENIRNASNTILTFLLAEKIRSEYKNNQVSQKNIAQKYGVAQCTISAIIHGHLWTTPGGENEKFKASSF